MRLKELPIIQYQNVSPDAGLHPLWVSLEAFRQQLEHLASGPFQVLSIDDALDLMERRRPFPSKRPISLTFDSGFLDFHQHVFPLLREYGLPATVLIAPPRVGTRRAWGEGSMSYLGWSHLEELTRHGVRVGAYEDGALNINSVPEAKVREHLLSYHKMLEDRLGREVRYFGVKEGVPAPEIRHLARSHGYRAFLTQCPTHRRPDLYALGRIQVDDDDFNIFLTKISRTYLFFKDKRVWKYIRRYRIDKVGHRISEGYDRLRGRGH